MQNDDFPTLAQAVARRRLEIAAQKLRMEKALAAIADATAELNAAALKLAVLTSEMSPEFGEDDHNEPGGEQ